jgi:hypothetical protein
MANPTTNYSFAMPTNTDLVKDLPADFDIFGQAVDDRVKALNPETTAGDISYRASTANEKTRLGIGTAGQVLTVNSGATAPEWATISAGSNWTLLNAGGTALTGAQTVTVSGISAKNKIAVIIDSASSASASTDVIIRFNTDTASNYTTFGNIGVASAAYAAGNFGGFKTSSTGFLIAKQNDNVAGISHAALFMDGCNSSGLKMVQGNGGGTDAGGGNGMRFYNFGGIYNSASVITSVSAFSNTGNWDAGTIFVYTTA